MKPKHLLILLAAGLLAIGLFNDAPTQAPTPRVPTEEDWREAFRQVRKWDVTIDLHIQDEDGDPVSDTLVSTRLVKPGSWEPDAQRSLFRSDKPDFHLEYDGAMAVEIHISKEDYQGEYLQLDFLHPPDWAQIATDKREQRYEKIVTLRKQGARKGSRASMAWLISPPDGDTQVLVLTDLHLPPVSRPSEEHPWTFTGLDRQVEITTNTLVTDYAYLYVDVVDDPTEEGVYHPVGFSQTLRPVIPTGKAMELGLRSDNPDDGLILVQPQESDHQKETWTDVMFPFPDRTDTAPEDGYSDRIRVPHSVYIRSESQPYPKMYFFIRLDGYYGRGRLQEVSVDEDLEAGGRVIVEIQPDGTREIDY